MPGPQGPTGLQGIVGPPGSTAKLSEEELQSIRNERQVIEQMSREAALVDSREEKAFEMRLDATEQALDLLLQAVDATARGVGKVRAKEHALQREFVNANRALEDDEKELLSVSARMERAEAEAAAISRARTAKAAQRGAAIHPQPSEKVVAEDEDLTPDFPEDVVPEVP